MIVIADNDIVHKLALCDLLDELLEWLQVPPNEVLVLPTLKFWGRKKLRDYSTALACFERFLQLTAEIPEATLLNLEKFSSLDSGEQQLMATFIEQTETPQLITGDKRALKQLTELSRQDEALYGKLNGNVDCLEGIMLELIRQSGFETINTKVRVEVDGVFRLVFGTGRTQEHAIEALQSFLGDLRKASPFVMPH